MTRNKLPSLDYSDKPWVERLMDKKEDLENEVGRLTRELNEKLREKDDQIYKLNEELERWSRGYYHL